MYKAMVVNSTFEIQPFKATINYNNFGTKEVKKTLNQLIYNHILNNTKIEIYISLNPTPTLVWLL